MTKVVVLNLIMLAVVLETDLGRRKITALRVARPIVTAAIIVPFFFTGVTTSGWGLTLEVVGVVVGVLLGLAAGSLLPVSFDPARRMAVSRGGAGYAALWTALTAARLLFAYGAQHWFARPLGTFLYEHQIGANAVSDTFIFLSVTMLLTRTARLRVGRTRETRRAQSVPRPLQSNSAAT
ncbi:MAG: hypothetical protein ACR2LX_07305 [Jatrophihabitans sp.]